MQKQRQTPSMFVLERAAEKSKQKPLAKKYGNASGIPRKDTARKLKQQEKEKMVLGHTSHGVYEDMRFLKKEYNWKFKVKGDTTGFLRDLCEDPFHVGLWRHEQLVHTNRVFSKSFRQKSLCIMEIDASSGFLSTSTSQLKDSKRVYFHVGIVYDY
ncbi:hypothetical protein [Pseudoalteromonas sp.]|uniref:hypothetical protein n=1 Tax=Pseudoalteromonas sp. TaxID=53249 RepID=UPI0026258682|nr:hypothetical protein [Pseudoalteromonas sp.]MCP4587080.1 hypothetical protein [Pseudoalteromonas sp.]